MPGMGVCKQDDARDGDDFGRQAAGDEVSSGEWPEETRRINAAAGRRKGMAKGGKTRERLLASGGVKLKSRLCPPEHLQKIGR